MRIGWHCSAGPGPLLGLFADSHLPYGLDRDTIRYFQDNYLATPADYTDWRASPLLAADFAGLPPAPVISAEFDPLLDDCVALVERFVREGV